MNGTSTHKSIPCHYCGRDTVGFDRAPIAQTGQAELMIFLRCGSCGWCFKLDLQSVSGRMMLTSTANIEAPEGLSKLRTRPLGITRNPDPAVKEPVTLFPTTMQGRYAGVPDESCEDDVEPCRDAI